ncbi:MAG TPA: hypothetical protein VE999_00015 [Gemmataceae bacterium]|nr:hypothetical protein [Gemmataceae bacterium]
MSALLWFRQLQRRWLPRRVIRPTPVRSHVRPRLEVLEDRVVPANITTDVYVNPTVQITPGMIVTETVTATVTPFPGFDRITGQITPVPAGAVSPTNGNVLFFLNGQVKSATLNANSQASATFQIPILAFLVGQKLDVYYTGFTDQANNDVWMDRTVRTSLYTNFDNLLLPGELTFAQQTPQQVYAFEINQSQNPIPTTLRPDLTTNGETDTLGNNLLAFNYVEPGVIQSITALGMTLPSSLAFQLGAYKGLQ